MYLAKDLAAIVILLLASSLASPTHQAGDTHPLTTRMPGHFQGSDFCGQSTFVNQNSAASPLIADCLGIVDNLSVRTVGNTGPAAWEVESFVKHQHQLVQHGSCAYGVQGGKGGDAWFLVGNQDIIDIIHTSVEKFGAGGTVGAKGEMSCAAGSFPPTVTWGIYHT
ncbi:hypothetical protein CONLIGDRAFT_677370 [Coniochaeta ligniaria NRRL 30616]|uniref:Ecp2 effector protein-like domain-containing protein n=1 Tax=Coniochaeta ligniaria NRRL 30616 TaxID=1408157 RepID=A0A1J7JJP9_9PEZI|nr:hypothetical protein CONLIGDRAFT_677370 [Coniochaeta ligniaria NRRL 30616]